ncbi:MAG: hypothetical protein LBN94_01770 [Puniceicoccales bacterium]|jgi:hypothetical protein|nr:hypothetical protein [Puniceicoccales bacterium]
MENAAEKLIAYVLTKLETEPVAERIKLYNVLADFVPNEEASSRLRQYTEELEQIDLKFQRIKALLFLKKHENYEH